jgi:SurA-like N-terminal domain
VSLTNCLRCGKETGEGELYCPQCMAAWGTRKQKRVWIVSLVFSGVLLGLAGLLLWHGGVSLGGLIPGTFAANPAAVINGESISEADFQARLQSVRRILERQNGSNLFAGERGRVLFETLRAQVLEEMVEERLVDQEARRLRIEVGGESIQQEIQRIAREIYGSKENFQRWMEEIGVQEKELQARVRNHLQGEAVKRAKAPRGEDPEAAFEAWLVQARQGALIEVSDALKRRGDGFAGAGGCCGSGPSSRVCGVQGRSGGKKLDPQTESKAQKLALEAYRRVDPSEQGVTAKVTDYGCHIQVDIQKEGRVVKSYTYQDGKVLEDS